MDSREGIALQNQIYQLRQEVQGLRSDIARGDSGASGGNVGGSGGDIVAQLLSRVQAMEEALRQMRGRIDETQNLIARQNADLSKRIDDLTFQLNLQGRGGASLSGAPLAGSPQGATPRTDGEGQPRAEAVPRIVMPGPPGTVPPPPRSFTFNQTPEPMREGPQPSTSRSDSQKPGTRAAPPQVADARSPLADGAESALAAGGKRTPEMALQEGHAALARRDYAAAERAAREVMGNRASPRAYDGQFLLAEALAGEKQYAQAAIAYDDAYNRSHKGRHAQDALVGLAGALTSINEKRAACDTLSRMRTEFPQVRADLQEAITKTNERAGCGH